MRAPRPCGGRVADLALKILALFTVLVTIGRIEDNTIAKAALIGFLLLLWPVSLWFIALLFSAFMLWQVFCGMVQGVNDAINER